MRFIAPFTLLATTSAYTLYCSNTSCADLSTPVFHSPTTQRMDKITLSTPYKYCFLDHEGATESPIEGFCRHGDEEEVVYIGDVARRPEEKKDCAESGGEAFTSCSIISY